jgi:hypothetical protein
VFGLLIRGDNCIRNWQWAFVMHASIDEPKYKKKILTLRKIYQGFKQKYSYYKK